MLWKKKFSEAWVTHFKRNNSRQSLRSHLTDTREGCKQQPLYIELCKPKLGLPCKLLSVTNNKVIGWDWKYIFSQESNWYHKSSNSSPRTGQIFSGINLKITIENIGLVWSQPPMISQLLHLRISLNILMRVSWQVIQVIQTHTWWQQVFKLAYFKQ